MRGLSGTLEFEVRGLETRRTKGRPAWLQKPLERNGSQQWISLALFLPAAPEDGFYKLGAEWAEEPWRRGAGSGGGRACGRGWGPVLWRPGSLRAGGCPGGAKLWLSRPCSRLRQAFCEP